MAGLKPSTVNGLMFTSHWTVTVTSSPAATGWPTAGKPETRAWTLPAAHQLVTPRSAWAACSASWLACAGESARDAARAASRAAPSRCPWASTTRPPAPTRSSRPMRPGAMTTSSTDMDPCSRRPDDHRARNGQAIIRTDSDRRAGNIPPGRRRWPKW